MALPLLAVEAQAQASKIEYTVNRQPLTSYDIDRRVAFFRLQQRKGGREAAAQDMINQMLRNQEAARQGITIGEQQINDAYANFAKSNKLTVAQLDQILSQAGVTKQHFREFIKSQMSWGQALQRRFQSRSRMSEQEAVQRMLKDGGRKPSAKEYLLQQVIFVVPERERGKLMAKRMREAEAMRGRINGCDGTMELAKTVLDVSVRNLGRVLELELPPEWKDSILATQPGKATKARQTERGVEILTVCSVREVSDDRVAQLVFQQDGKSDDERAAEMDKTYLEEVRKRAQIVKL
jgi:peptidyl-prolyl cis-trans isomerase SurA